MNNDILPVCRFAHAGHFFSVWNCCLYFLFICFYALNSRVIIQITIGTLHTRWKPEFYVSVSTLHVTHFSPESSVFVRFLKIRVFQGFLKYVKALWKFCLLLEIEACICAQCLCHPGGRSFVHSGERTVPIALQPLLQCRQLISKTSEINRVQFVLKALIQTSKNMQPNRLSRVDSHYKWNCLTVTKIYNWTYMTKYTLQQNAPAWNPWFTV